MAPRVRVCAEGISLGDGARWLDHAVAHHLVRVLRLSEGDRLTVFDGMGSEQHAVVIEVSALKREVRVAVALDGAARAGVVADSARVHVLQGAPKGDKLERVVRSCAELGAAAVWPVQCERSVAKLDAARAAAQRAHLHAVSVSASEQCGRADLLRVEECQSIAAVIAAARNSDLVGCIADEAGGEPARCWIERVGRAVENRSQRPALAVFVGPEGGLTDEERDRLRAAGFASISLGPRILRTEHAAAAFVAMASVLTGDNAAQASRAPA